MTTSTLPSRSINVFEGLKIFKTNDFVQAGERRYWSLDKTWQEHIIGNLVADLSYVTNPAIQRQAIANLMQADETLAGSCCKGAEPLGVERSLIGLADLQIKVRSFRFL